jgi:hypothetical protein
MHMMYTFLERFITKTQRLMKSILILVFNFNGVRIIENFDIGNFDVR